MHRQRREIDRLRGLRHVLDICQRYALHADFVRTGRIRIQPATRRPIRIQHDAILAGHEICQHLRIELRRICHRRFLRHFPRPRLITQRTHASNERRFARHSLQAVEMLQIRARVERLKRDAFKRARDQLLFEGHSFEFGFYVGAPARQGVGERIAVGRGKIGGGSHEMNF